MKKLIVFVMILCCLASTAVFKIEKNVLFELQGINRVCFVSDEKFDSESVEVVVSGSQFFNYCSLTTAKENLKEFANKSQGVQLYFENKDLEVLKKELKFQEVTQIKIENLTIYCGYTPFYQNCVYVENKKVNVQIAISDENKIVAGFPVILTGY